MLYGNVRDGADAGALFLVLAHRIVPASRIPNAGGLTNQATTLAPSLLAPPSSPPSFNNSGSALPSTAQSPSCFLSLSANSLGCQSTVFGPYAHETQLVSPPVFSTFTTEPSTAPLTPPLELANLTTPSSPDVPFAQFLSSSADPKRTEKSNYIAATDLQATYSLYPGSPASSLISPISRTSGNCLSSSFPERDFHPQWDPSISPQNGKYSRSDANFFCPATFARFYLDHNPPFPHTDVYPAAGNGHQDRHNRSPMQDAEELEAYRASFGFSADEITTTQQYVEISDVMDHSFTMTPFTSNKPTMEESVEATSRSEGQKAQTSQMNLPTLKLESDTKYEDDDIFSKMKWSKNSRRYDLGSSCSDAEIDYRRGRSLREGKGDLAWQ
ncbi:hypothetical protein MANES_05G113447v8 [Manihot esculenta]|uniref:Uncharacterized protein n=1 Tax=Manihot esculenta TaxID=3983 RepID=A0ACB7HPJ8_MANES|nr:hypothetical protein MANES_05G113447v8 [Manihot esculenta]